MATRIGLGQCVTCGYHRMAYKCEGCLLVFCQMHFVDHREILATHLDDFTDEGHLFRQILSEQSNHPQKHSLIQKIDRWEKDSIRKVQQTAEEARQLVLEGVRDNRNEIEVKLCKLTGELKQLREEEDFTETHLHQFKEKLKKLEEQLNKSTNISLQEENQTAFINKISVSITLASEKLFIPDINIHTKWRQNGITVAGGRGNGEELNQLYYPLGIYVDDDQTIYIADQYNHRIVERKEGATYDQEVESGSRQGNLSNQLSYPKNVTVDKKNNCLVICDQGNNRVVRWPLQNGTSEETIISNIQCYGVTIDDSGYIYASDFKKHEVRRWKIGETNGTLAAGGNGCKVPKRVSLLLVVKVKEIV